MSSENSESPTAPVSISSTLLSQLGLGDSTSNPLSGLTLEPDSQALSKPPTTKSSLVDPLNKKQTLFAEEPLYRLIGKTIEDMTVEELKAHVERLRTLRKSPQTFAAKVKKDEEALDAEYGESEDKKIRAKASKTVEEKTKRTGQTAAVLGAKLANKWLAGPKT